MATKQPPATRWQESTTGFDRIDRNEGIIRGVKVLGLTSKNRRRYLKEAAEKASPRYNNSKIFIDHVDPKAPSPRKTRERWGMLKDVAPDASGELYGDLHYLKTHPMTESILEAAERFKDFGLSHDAGGKTRVEKGETVVYEIAEVYSVDLVQDPATVRNLFESHNPMKRIGLLQALRENIKIEPAVMLLARMTEMDDIYDEASEMEVPEDASGGDMVATAFRSAIMSIVDGDLDVKAKIEKIRMLLDVQQKVSSDTSSEDNMSKDENKVSEEVQKRLDTLEAENKALREEKQLAVDKAACEKLLESAKREVSDVRVKALLKLDEADRQSLVESWPEVTAKPARPAASPSKFRESVDESKVEIPSDLTGLKKLLHV